MPGLNTDVVNNITGTAIGKLKKQLRGGVTTQSAIDAINDTAQAFKTVTEKELGASQNEINQLRREAGISAARIAELTSERDTAVLGLQSKFKDYKNTIDALKARLEKALGIRTQAPRTLNNGNIEQVKMNKNGAKMTTITLPDDRKISVEVETTAGKRKTTYNPITGKPIKTFTNVRSILKPNEVLDKRTLNDRLITYDSEGGTKSIKNVNVKKVKPQKPEVVSNEIVSTKNGIITTRKVFSDGSYELGEIIIIGHTKLPSSLKVYNKNDIMIQETQYKYINNNLCRQEITNYNPETNKKVSEIVRNGKMENGNLLYDRSEECLYNERGDSYKKITTFKELGGLKQIITAKVDEFGIVDKSNPAMEYIYPKSSQIKSSKVDFAGPYDAKKETLKLRNGSTVEVKINGNYDPYHVIIREKGKPDREINGIEQAKEYLTSIGKACYIKDNSGWNGIYSNYI